MTVSRRQFFTRFARSLTAGVIGKDTDNAAGDAVSDPVEKSKRRTWVRPPGAIAEDSFRSTCTRCTACQEACPYTSIRRLGPEFDADSGTPAIIVDESPCYLCPDMPCIAACEPKALLPVDPASVRMGKAVMDVERCYVAQGQPCDYCLVRCPLGERAIHAAAGRVPVIDPAGCAGCGVCVYLCPGDALSIDTNIY